MIGIPNLIRPLCRISSIVPTGIQSQVHRFEPIRLSTMDLDMGFQRRWKADDRRTLIASMPTKDMGTQGETGVDIDLIVKSKEDMFPTLETPDMLFNGVRFADLPVCHIKTTPNNTIISVTDAKGRELYGYRSCGMEGFKNTRKGTNIAAQATAITLGTELVKKSVKTVRVKIQGIGPGRMSSVKGLQMAGLDIVSLTDSTHISYHPPRAKKQRRL